MIGLREYVLNEVSSDLLMKAAKKAKEIGDPRAKKFFDAAMKRMEEEFNKMEINKRKQAVEKSKKIFSKLAKLGDPLFGWGSGGTDTMKFERDGHQGFLMIRSNYKGTIPTKALVGGNGDLLADIAASEGMDHISDQLKEKVAKMKDEDQIMFFTLLISPDKETKDMEVYRNCNYTQGIMLITKEGKPEDRILYSLYTEYRPDGKIYRPKLDITKPEDKMLSDMLLEIVNMLCK